MNKILKWTGIFGANAILCYYDLGPFDGWQWWAMAVGVCLWKICDE